MFTFRMVCKVPHLVMISSVAYFGYPEYIESLVLCQPDKHL